MLISGYFRAIGVALDKKRLVTFTVGNLKCGLSAANLKCLEMSAFSGTSFKNKISI